MIFTYIIQRGLDGPVKIGQTNNPSRRLDNLQTGSAEPLRLVCVLEGNAEREIHQRLVGERLCGEWFRASPFTWDVLFDYGVEIEVSAYAVMRVVDRYRRAA